MVISTALISGFKYEIREKLFSFWGQVLVVPYYSEGSDITVTTPITADPQLSRSIAGTAHVSQVAPFILKPAIIHAKGEMEGIRLKGVTAGFRFHKGLALTGRGLGFGDTAYSKDIILSRTTAARLNLKEGDHLLLYAIDPGSTAPRVRKLQVAGLFHTGMEEVDKEFGICDMRLLQRLSDWDSNQISGYQIELDNTSLADTMASQIYYNYLQPPMESYSITHTYEGVFSWLNMQDVNARILLIIVGIMAVINLSAALLILMVDRSVTIGLLKALGMPDAGLQYIFIYLAGLIGLWGLLLGNVLGLGLCLLQQHLGFLHLPEDTYYMQTVPIRIIWWHVLMIDAGTLLLCLLCMTLPTLYIRRIQTARVLQFK